MIFFCPKSQKLFVQAYSVFVHANFYVCPCKFRRASMQIPLCVHANSVCASMQMNGKEKKKTFFRAVIFDHFRAKIAKSETNVHFNVSLRNLFAIGRLDFQPLYMGGKRSKKREQKVAQTIDGHRNLETESAQWANSVKKCFVRFTCIWHHFGKNCMIKQLAIIKKKKNCSHCISTLMVMKRV